MALGVLDVNLDAKILDGFPNAVKLAASGGKPSVAVAASAHPPVLWSSRRKPEIDNVENFRRTRRIRFRRDLRETVIPKILGIANYREEEEGGGGGGGEGGGGGGGGGAGAGGGGRGGGGGGGRH
uniref:Uncharacterized protein n=1 Tax=Vespula pensylvanica TaxID=30213 RepID=A0A834NE35_VESPE|nr:hypothetical protein H0235_014767 [Vespula pensylvanica]